MKKTKSHYDMLKAQFERFDNENPHVWGLLVKLAKEAKHSGVDKLSISLLIERMRWELVVATKSDVDFKISNNHRAFYARKLMKNYPELKGMFVVKQQRSVNY